MLKRSEGPFSDFWVLPGGFINYTESPGDAVRREIKEEIGLNLEIEGIVNVYRIDDEPRGAEVDIVFDGTATGEAKLEKESFSEFKYFAPDELPEKIAYKHREMIERWNSDACDCC